MPDVHPARQRAATVVVIAAAVAAACAGLAVSLWVAHTHGQPMAVALLGAAAAGSFTVVGAVVAGARPGNGVGWLMLAGGVAWAVGSAGVDVGRPGVLVAAGSVPAASIWLVAGSALRGAGWWTVVIGVPMWFPDGRVAGPRWRWLPAALAVVVVGSVLGVLTAADANVTGLGGWHNPVAVPSAAQWVSGLVSLATVGVAVLAAGAAVVGLWSRWRRGGPLQRQQLTLIALAACVPVLAAPVVLATGAGWIFSVAAVPLPIAVGRGVLARGLYDLRTAVNRTLVWATLSAVVAGLYALVLVGVGSRLDANRSSWLPWLAAAVVAVTFAPLRNTLQRAVNRLTFGRWDEPYQVLADLGRRLQATGDVDRLLADVITELDGLGLADVAIVDDRGHTVAGHSDVASQSDAPGGQPGREPMVSVPLFAYQERVGELRYRPSPAGLRSRDRQLLDDLARHLGSVLHARDLNRDLQHTVERVVLAREEERRRLRRDLHDGLGPALAGHLLQLDVVAARLEPSSPARRDVDAVRRELATTVLDVRRVVEGLRPPALDELGLAGALAQATGRLTAGTPVAVALDIDVDQLDPLPAAVEVAAFRIVTEAVTNVVRHAAATTCRVSIDEQGGRLRIRVDDNGRGIGRTDGGGRQGLDGHGLATMRERAEELRGWLTVQPQDGTILIAEVPLSGHPTQPPAVAAERR